MLCTFCFCAVYLQYVCYILTIQSPYTPSTEIGYDFLYFYSVNSNAFLFYLISIAVK